MHRIIFTLLMVFFAATQAGAEQHLYLAAGGELAVHRIDPQSGRLTPVQSLDLPGAAGFARSPDGKFLYAMTAVNRQPAMTTLRFLAAGKLEIIHQAPVNLSAGYLDVDAGGDFIAGSHYGPGKVTIWKLEEGVYRGKTVQELSLEPKSHSSIFSPNNRWLLVPATGPNKVFINRFDPGTGKIVPSDPPFARGPQIQGHAQQPRHLTFHPNGETVYTTNEREAPGVGVWKWNAKRGLLQPVQDIVTQPGDFSGIITTADLHLTPDVKYLYVSNRDITHRKAPTGRDSIVGFRVDAKDGRLKLIAHTACERHPRSFTIDETGRFVYVAGQVDSRLGVYRIDQRTGVLSKVTRYDVGSRPSWVETYDSKR
ncbi:MAG: 6-phosphogluconolactonase [Limisphaerales bacterium]|jgi:6-phosphogluconolactonase